MATSRVEAFQADREALNDLVLKYAGKTTKRFFNLDHNTYQEGALPKPTKELLGLVASLVLRCDDCILYHLIQCYEQGFSSEEIEEAMSVALVVGGSITIPHLRRAFQAWDELKSNEGSE